MPTQLEKAAARWAPAVKFTYNNGATVQRYIRTEIAAGLYDVDGTGAAIWLGEPRMTWRMKKEIHGGTRDTPFEVEMPRESLGGFVYEPLASMISDVHSPVTVHIYEVNFEATGTIGRCVFVGMISRTVWRPLGKSDIIKAEIVGRKARLKDVPLGIVATDRCAWTFGDITCEKNLGAIDDNATIDSVDGTNLWVNGLANKNDSGGGNGWYTRGYVEYQGLRIMIRSHVENAGADPTKLRMAIRPPASWEVSPGPTVLVVPGCDKSVDDCLHWDGEAGGGVEQNFGGFGRKMPKYHPVIEDGAC